MLCIDSNRINSATSSYCNALMPQTTVIKCCIDLNKSVYCISTLIVARPLVFLCLRASVITKESDRIRLRAVSACDAVAIEFTCTEVQLVTKFVPKSVNHRDDFSLRNVN